MESKSPQRLFFEFAFPCLHFKKLATDRGIKMHNYKLSPSEYRLFEDQYLSGSSPPEEVLERLFPDASGGMDIVSAKVRAPKWSHQVVYSYCSDFHNAIIDKGEWGYDIWPKSARDLCRYNFAKVESVKSNKALVTYASPILNKTVKREVHASLFPKLKSGDNIAVHYHYAVPVFNL